MRVRFLVYFMFSLLIFALPSNAFADDMLGILPMPTLASTPLLPSLDAFGTPSPPDVFANVGNHMPGFEFWEEKINEKKDEKKNAPPHPQKAPVDATYAATLSWPVHGRISSPFGPRNNTVHEGVDIPVPKGTPIQAAANGVVAEARAYRGYGYTVILDHENGVRTLYAHCSELAVKQGERVKSGRIIAYAGSTGRASSSHVHFAVMVRGAFRDPVAYLKERPQQLANNPFTSAE